MKKLILPFLVLIFIIGRCEISSAMNGTHVVSIGGVIMPDLSYFLNLFVYNNIIDYIVIGCLLFLYDTKGNCHLEWFKKCGMVFSFGVVAIMLIYLMPSSISHYLSIIKNPLYSTGGFIGTCLCLYYLICYRNNMFKGEKVA